MSLSYDLLVYRDFYLAKFEYGIDRIPFSGCWIWTKSVDTKGSGHMKVEGRMTLVHRLSWELFKGSIPNGIFVLHKCHVRCCANPDHLYLGEHIDNVVDAIEAKQYYNSRLTHCLNGHEFSKENTYVYTDRYNGRTKRRCRKCYSIRRRLGNY